MNKITRINSLVSFGNYPYIEIVSNITQKIMNQLIQSKCLLLENSKKYI
jgi:hypothetical protein